MVAVLFEHLPDIAVKDGPWLTAGAILISATVALAVAICTIITNRSIARKRATLDLIIKSETDDHFQELYKNYVIIRDETPDSIMSVYPTLEKLYAIRRSEDAVSLKNIASEQEIENFKTIQYHLNYCELVAIGIDNKILDEKFYRKWTQISYVNTWKDCEEFIREWRKLGKYDKYFERFEHYAEKWRLPWLHWVLGWHWYDPKLHGPNASN